MYLYISAIRDRIHEQMRPLVNLSILQKQKRTAC